MERGSALAKRCALGFITSAYAGAAAGHVLPSDVPWSAIFRLASAESCLATLCDCILSKDIPQQREVADLLRLFRDKEQKRNAQITGVLDETLALLASRGVVTIPLKGAAFLASGSACSRSMADIDLLVRPSDKTKAFEALKSEGYKLAVQGDWYEYMNHHHAPPILDPSGAIAIELHTRLAPHFDKGAISTDVIFANAQGGFIGNSTVFIPSDTHRLVHLIIHSMIADNGYWLIRIRLRDLIDLLEIHKAGRIDWQALRATFAEIGYEGRAAGFLLASEFLLFPAFQAPEWTVRSRRWAERAVQAFFDPDLFRGRRAVGQFLADIEATVQNPRRLRIVLLPDRLKQFAAARWVMPRIMA